MRPDPNDVRSALLIFACSAAATLILVVSILEHGVH